MNLVRTLAFTACLSMSLSSLAQVSPTFDPDYDGSGAIGTNDLLGFLSTYGLPWEGATGTEGCTYLYFLEYDPAANIDDGSCATLDELICDYSLYSLTLALPGGAYGEPLTVPAFGSLQSLDVTLDFGNPGGDESWASDLRLEIGLPDGSCAAIGGYDVFGECTDLGNGSSVWGVLWNVQQDGVYTATVDLSDAGLSGTGLWSFTALNGFATSASVNYGITLQANGLCSPATAVCSNPDALGVCGGSCSADADGDGICDDVDPCVGELDTCGVCNGPGAIYDCGCSGIPAGDCDCDGNQLDALGVCGGSCSADANGDGICDDVDPAQFQCGNPISYQGYDYATVLIGEQCWFAENLRSQSFNTGEAIPSSLNNSAWSSTTLGAVSVYEEDVANLGTYGRLYNWYAVDDIRGLCPNGWAVPSANDWNELVVHLGDGSNAASALKSDFGWSNGSNGTNSSGFSGMPGGARFYNGEYFNIEFDGYWWSSSPDGALASYLFLSSDPQLSGVNFNSINRGVGLSVRCTKGSTAVLGCTNLSGCNYNEFATIDDGSCTYAEEFYDCNGNCLNDENGNGVCDEEEPLFPCGDDLIYQGFVYSTVQIGGQCWFADNLSAQFYRNGDFIPQSLSSEDWSSTTSGASAVQPGTSILGSPIYGRLYNHYAVTDARGLCPFGWRVPTDIEWIEMELTLGMSASVVYNIGLRGTDQGYQMKTTYGWDTDLAGLGSNGSNSSGFSGLPGGYRWHTELANFGAESFQGFWWSSTVWLSGEAPYRWLEYTSDRVGRGAFNRGVGLSVRCITDTE